MSVQKNIRIRCWVEADGEKYFGPGPYQLLKQIEQEGSLSKAAEAIHISYRKAWDLIKKLNENAAQTIVILHKGGEKGGGAEITETGIKLIENYEALQEDLENTLLKHQSILEQL